MTRLFVGTFLTNEDQQKIAGVIGQNKHLEELWQRKPRWVKANKLHLTWLFIGDIDDELVSKLSSTLGKTMEDRSKLLASKTKQELVVEFNKIEAWPSSRKPRMVVLANKPVLKEVQSLANTICMGLIPFFTAETEQESNLEFRPHVTLLRLDRRIENHTEKDSSPLVFPKFDPRIDVAAIADLSEALPIKLKVHEICLIESRQRGNDYKVLDSFKV